MTLLEIVNQILEKANGVFHIAIVGVDVFGEDLPGLGEDLVTHEEIEKSENALGSESEAVLALKRRFFEAVVNRLADTLLLDFS